MAIIIPIIAKFVDEGIRDAKKAMGEATTGTEKWAAALDSMAGPAKAASVAVGTLLFSTMKNAGQSVKANKKLQASFTAIGYPENAKAAMAYADSLQHVIGVSDEEIQASMQKLAAFEDVAKSQDLMARATQTAADMSAAGFGTMESAATALGKALQDPERNLGALTRMGVTFTKQQRKQIDAMIEAGDIAGAQAIIMGTAEKKFAGIAKESASGTAKMKLAWDEFAETLGMTLVPILGALNVILTKIAGWMGKNADSVRALLLVTLGLTAAIVVADKAMKAYAVAQLVASKAAKILGISTKAAMGWIGLLVAAIVIAAFLIIKNWDKIKAATIKVWDAIMGFLRRTWEKIKSQVRSTWNWITSTISKAWSLIKKIVSVTPFGLFIRALVALVRVVINNWDKIVATTRKAWDKIKGFFKTNPFTAIRGFLETMKGWFTSTFNDILGKMRDLVDKIKGAAEDIKGAFNKAKDLADRMPRPGKKSTQSASLGARTIAFPIAGHIAGGVPVPQAGIAAGRVGTEGGVTINVNGALDPERVARQIRRLLDNHDRRQGRAVVRPVAF